MICKICLLDKQREQGIWTGKTFLYLTEGKQWLGRICPNCINKYHSIRKKKKIKTLLKSCKYCNNSFNTRNKYQKFCNKDCSYKNQLVKQKSNSFKIIIKCKTCFIEFIKVSSKQYCSIACKPKKKRNKKVIIKKTYLCITCNINTPNRKHCSETCRQKYYYKLKKSKGINLNKDALWYKKAKRNARIKRKMKQCQALPKWINTKELNSIYNHCPLNMHIDHIIPLNHKDVCGLHVPWNLQYLNPEDNIFKSNKFDYTLDNLSWKKK